MPSMNCKSRAIIPQLTVPHFINNPVQSGCPQQIIEIDESLFCRNKCNWGRIQFEAVNFSRLWSCKQGVFVTSFMSECHDLDFLLSYCGSDLEQKYGATRRLLTMESLLKVSNSMLLTTKIISSILLLEWQRTMLRQCGSTQKEI